MTGDRKDEEGSWLHMVTPEEALLREGHEPRHQVSLTGAAADALRLGAVQAWLEVRPDEDALFRAGDPDLDASTAEASGEDAPGSSNASPDDSDIDDVGALYGVADSDGGPEGLVLGDDLIAERDRHRWENDPRSKDP